MSIVYIVAWISIATLAIRTTLNLVNLNHYKSLHIVLILLLLLAPLRSVFAMQFASCNMKVMSSPDLSDTTMPGDHCQSVVTTSMTSDALVNITVQSDDSSDRYNDHQTDNCCTDNGVCVSDCHFTISLSMFLQDADFLPVLLNTAVFDNIANTPLIRALSPLSKPPLFLYS